MKIINIYLNNKLISCDTVLPLILEIVKKSGGINYTVEKMKAYQKEALSLLKTFDDNESRKSLELLVNFVIERKK